MTRSTKNIEAVDLFCGIGGLSYGLEKARVSVKAGLDIDPKCRHAFDHNISGKFLLRDVTTLSGDEISPLYSKGSVSLLAGCAPCQPYSTYRRATKGMPRQPEWDLVEKFGQLVEEVGPDLVTMENVPPLADQPVFASLLSSLHGYNVDWDIVEMKALGLPQTRKRLVLVGSKIGPIKLEFKMRKIATVRETISDLPPLKAGTSAKDDPMHRASRLSPLNLQRIRASRPGGTWRDWPPKLRAACHKRESGATFPSVYGRMSWDEPSPTITTQCFGFGNGRFGHPDQDRAISLREAAMLQGFPRDYEFLPMGGNPNFASFGRLIGNAVPVPLGQALGELFTNHVTECAGKNLP